MYEGRRAGAAMLGVSGWNARFEWEHRADYFERFAAFDQGLRSLEALRRLRD